MCHLACNNCMNILHNRRALVFRVSVRVMLLVLMPVLYTQAQSTITLHFDNVAGDKDLELDSGKYVNAAGEEFSVNILQYFISNIQFTSVDGSVYTIPQDSSYFF